jgi:hypothetical protein
VHQFQQFYSYSFSRGSLGSERLGLGVENKETKEHVYRTSTIEAGSGDVNLIASNGTISNRASDIYAGKSINLQAGNIKIEDATHSTKDKQSRMGIDFTLPVVTSLNFSGGGQSKTTQVSSNLFAGQNLKLDANNGRIDFIASNGFANENINFNARDINITSNKFTDTFETSGGGLSVGLWPGAISVGINGYSGDGKQETITPSYLSSKNMNLNGQKTVSVHSSEIDVADNLTINTNKFSATGEYEKADSQSLGFGGSILLGPYGVPNLPLGGMLKWKRLSFHL